MCEIYDAVSFESSRVVTKSYSTSFTLGIKMLDKKMHKPIYGIYGFVRLIDEIVDTFKAGDTRRMLEEAKIETHRAIEEKISLNPIIHAFQIVVNQYNIEWEMVDAFFNSMEMDLENTKYDNLRYEEYIYGSAEVVGLMCLKVFCHGDEAYYQELKAPARSLGAAFQKVNFLRDVQADYEDRGRVYFPGVNFDNFTLADKRAIEKDIEKDFEDAMVGILKLPRAARFGVYVAYKYYAQLLKKIQNTPPSEILNSRIRIPDGAKYLLSATSYLKYRLHLI